MEFVECTRTLTSSVLHNMSLLVSCPFPSVLEPALSLKYKRERQDALMPLLWSFMEFVFSKQIFCIYCFLLMGCLEHRRFVIEESSYGKMSTTWEMWSTLQFLYENNGEDTAPDILYILFSVF